MKLNKLFFFLMLALSFSCTVYTRGGNCQFCGEWQTYNLSRHERYYCKKNPHKEKFTTVYTRGGNCQFCGEWQTNNLSRHEQYYCKKNPHKEKFTKEDGYCQFCKEWKSNVFCHERYRCNQNPYKITKKRGGICKHCGEWKKGVSQHEKYYCNQNPHKITPGGNCQFCKKQFYQLKSHEKRCALNPAHRARPKVTCPSCKKKFKRLKSHQPYCKKRKRDLSGEQLVEPPTKQRKTKKNSLVHFVGKIVEKKDKPELFDEALFSVESIEPFDEKFDHENLFNAFDNNQLLLDKILDKKFGQQAASYFDGNSNTQSLKKIMQYPLDFEKDRFTDIPNFYQEPPNDSSAKKIEFCLPTENYEFSSTPFSTPICDALSPTDKFALPFNEQFVDQIPDNIPELYNN